jgi:flavorubredoxin
LDDVLIGQHYLDCFSLFGGVIIMDKPYQPAADTVILPSHVRIPGMGFLPCNAYVISAAEPVLVDAGLGIDSDEFMNAIASVIDPQNLKWIWITHDDSDHVGSIQRVLDAAPSACLATNAVTALRMSASWQVPMNRVYCLNAGESISVGDRKLTAVAPPLFDNPATIGFYDDKANAFYSADFFGAILPAPGVGVGELSEEALSQGMTLWGTIDSPWVHHTDRGEYRRKLDTIRQMEPEMIFSSHLPPATGKAEQFLRSLATVPEASPFVAPNQAALEQIMAQAA